ncbi:MAG: hypothetical protein K8R85_10125 [Bacteroidetes bacterium]|nr:hypothetical protein [Bacteroidota bacterium]
MDFIENINPVFFATAILCSATIFTIVWFLDSVTHGKLVKIDITDKELQTHRIILATSVLMELSLVLMFWFNFEMLPFFVAFFITRTVHEFIDELHWHTDRCSQYESFLHLGMWISVLSKTFLMFMWGFFTQYKGLTELNIGFYIWGVIVVGLMGLIGLVEWKR